MFLSFLSSFHYLTSSLSLEMFGNITRHENIGSLSSNNFSLFSISFNSCTIFLYQSLFFLISFHYNHRFFSWATQPICLFHQPLCCYILIRKLAEPVNERKGERKKNENKNENKNKTLQHKQSSKKDKKKKDFQLVERERYQEFEDRSLAYHSRDTCCFSLLINICF
ncbi:hypothetical protein BZL39_B00800 [Zygosaccharomyces parabailii]|nr:hypothetical protein BZL39_B00800 [Zygosaccharomyces parabailii]